MMVTKSMMLTEAGKEELALALLLWRDFKSEGKFDPQIVAQMFQFADQLNIRNQLEKMMSKVPVMKIVPRDF
jgi:hypothetical protein